MIPESVDMFNANAEDDYEVLPSFTYKLDFINKRIQGKVDESAAVMQFIRKVLDTDKYAWVIYDWYYGNELLKLVGQPYDFVIVEIPRIIAEALLVDDRIIDITDYKFNQTNLDSMTVTCLVHTVYGNLPLDLEVAI